MITKKIKDRVGFETEKEELIDISGFIIEEAKKIQDMLKEDNDD